MRAEGLGLLLCKRTHPIRRQFDLRSSNKLCGRHWPRSVSDRSIPVRRWPSLVDAVPYLTDAGRSGAQHHSPSLAKVSRSQTQVDRRRSKLSPKLSPNSARLRPASTLPGPIPTEFGPDSTECGRLRPNLAQLGQTAADIPRPVFHNANRATKHIENLSHTCTRARAQHDTFSNVATSAAYVRADINEIRKRPDTVRPRSLDGGFGNNLGVSSSGVPSNGGSGDRRGAAQSPDRGSLEIFP